MALDQSGRTAKLCRMVIPAISAPTGSSPGTLLERQGYTVEDHHLTSPEETEAFKAEHGVRTTPQNFIDGERIGGHDDLRAHFGKRSRRRTPPVTSP